MKPTLQFDEQELRALIRKLDDMPDRISRRVRKKALNFAATPITRAIRQETPRGPTGNLRKSVGKNVKTYGEDFGLAIIGPRISGGYRGFHGHLVHDGHVARDGSFVPGNPFLKRGAQRGRSEALARLQAKLAEGIEKEAKKK